MFCPNGESFNANTTPVTVTLAPYSAENGVLRITGIGGINQSTIEFDSNGPIHVPVNMIEYFKIPVGTVTVTITPNSSATIYATVGEQV